MAEIINLRTQRKRKQRSEKESAAKTNRTVHGMPLAERKKIAAKKKLEMERLDGHLIDKN